MPAATTAHKHLASYPSQIDSKTQEADAERHRLELLRREVAQAKSAAAAQQGQQAELDALAARFDADCLATEDKLDHLAALRECTKGDLMAWSAAEAARVELGTAAAADASDGAAEVRALQRRLEATSIEATAARSRAEKNIAEAKCAEAELAAAQRAADAAREHAAAMRRQLDAARLSCASRRQELLEANQNLALEDKACLIDEKRLKDAVEGLEAEAAAGVALRRAAAEAERSFSRGNERLRASQDKHKCAQQAQRDAKIDLRRTRMEASSAAARAVEARQAAERAAADLSTSLQRHQELLDAEKAQEDATLGVTERAAAVAAAAAPLRSQARQLEQRCRELGSQRDRMTSSIEALKEESRDNRSKTAQAKAQAAGLTSQAASLHGHWKHHQENLYRLQYQLFAGQRAAAEAVSQRPDRHLDPTALRSLKRSLQQDLDAAAAAERDATREVAGAEDAARQVAAAAAQARVRVQQLSEEHTTEELNAESAEKELKVVHESRDAARLAADRAALAVGRARERLAQTAAAGQSAATVASKELEDGKIRELDLQAKLEELATDEAAARRAALFSCSAAAGATAAQAKAQAAVQTIEWKTNEASSTVSGVVEALQRQVEELTAALAAAETEVGVLEAALESQRGATAASRDDIRFGEDMTLKEQQESLRKEIKCGAAAGAVRGAARQLRAAETRLRQMKADHENALKVVARKKSEREKAAHGAAAATASRSGGPRR